MRVHLIGIFYTIHSPSYSQCAFTNKCLNFVKMMQPRGYEIIEYANEGSMSVATNKVPILRADEFARLKELYAKEAPPNQPAYVATTLCRQFEAKVVQELRRRVEPGDIICHPLGYTHSNLGKLFPDCHHLENGIGYTNTFFPLKVFESYAWWQWHQGRAERPGNAYEWVIPHFYDVTEWEPRYEPGSYVLYFGRITADKGLEIVKEIAKRTEREVILCGGGDPAPFLDSSVKNLVYKAPVNGLARSELLRNAYCMVMPTMYSEPFGSAGVEGMLCGTPLLSSDFGAFSETVEQGVTGFRCKTLGDWTHAIAAAGSLDRRTVADLSRRKFGMETCGELYHRVLQQIDNMTARGGWYYDKPLMAIPPSTAPFFANLSHLTHVDAGASSDQQPSTIVASLERLARSAGGRALEALDGEGFASAIGGRAAAGDVAYGAVLAEPAKIRSVLHFGLRSAGSAIRALKDRLPAAALYGADADDKLLFEDDRIRTFRVDRRAAAELDQLAGKLPETLDVIIDGGPQTSVPDLAVLPFAIGKLADGGWLLVEDVPSGAVPLWQVATALLPAAYRCYLVRTGTSHLFAVQKRAAA